MFIAIITLCTSAAMTDCEVYSLSKTETKAQCEHVAQAYREVLGINKKSNYRIECEPVTGEKK